ncbi:polyketide cyclase [Hylemonella gracilis str. Niagara R]|uniref:Polyketide cyclase n=1 Tax=Hylemonella gracilis str. Niagara R TaxID=1458275 RepID=A0A016XHS0_9BURK|nr:SRPBCC family protein [Hylemonella gracilis]EYC50773.1 polyketide cyclase [Hylemonella gracilis str. Niagara R]
MHVEHQITIAASPRVIFQIYADVSNWHTWDPDTRKASLDGPFEIGTRGRLTPTQGNTVPMLLTELVADRCFTVESRIPLFRMCFEHELSPVAGNTEVTHRVTFSGLLSVVLGPMLCKRLNAGLPVTLARLKAMAESGERKALGQMGAPPR